MSVPPLGESPDSRVRGLAKDERSLEGIVMELLPSALVRVRLEGEHEVVAHMPAAQRANFVRLRVGDKVRVALSPSDRTRGRVLELLTKS
jgi:translation initiation factor IF-1